MTAASRANRISSKPSLFTSPWSATAEEEDVNRIFGHEGDPRYFHVGQPLDMDTPVCIDLESFIERSNGIFGKTGTGKTFLTRLMLAGLIHKDRAVNLIFDMHSEYGWQATQESGSGGRLGFVKGLKQLFGSKVAIFTIDPESARRRGVQSDFAVKIPLQPDHRGKTSPRCRTNSTCTPPRWSRPT